MSDAQKVRMSMAAAGKTPREYELHVRKLMKAVTCPCVSVFAASGGPSTENSFTCEFDTGIPGWYPNCPSFGRKESCKALQEMYKRTPRDYKRLKALVMVQALFSMYTPRVEHSVGWFEVLE